MNDFRNESEKLDTNFIASRLGSRDFWTAIRMKKKTKKFLCPGCGAIWTVYDLWFTDGDCLTEDCKWDDILEEIQE